MRAVHFARFGGPEVLELIDKPAPRPGVGEVLIKVAAAGLNRADLAQRDGSYPVPIGSNAGLGLEAAGEVVAAGGGVPASAVGSLVCTLTPGGAYAEYVVAPWSHCLRVPQEMSLHEAAALPEAAMTVWSNVFEMGGLVAGGTLLVHGGASGIGTFAIQYATALGCRVIATAGGSTKCEAVRALGAEAIDHRLQDFEREVMRITEERGVNVVLDMVGGDYTNRNLRCLAMDGRLVQIAWLQGAQVQIDLLEISKRRAVLTGSLLRPRSVEDKARIVEALKESIWPLYDTGMRPVIHATYPVAQVADAHRELESGRHIGKIVLTF
jgi:NADPH2:quinone reductase